MSKSSSSRRSSSAEQRRTMKNRFPHFQTTSDTRVSFASLLFFSVNQLKRIPLFEFETTTTTNNQSACSRSRSRLDRKMLFFFFILLGFLLNRNKVKSSFDYELAMAVAWSPGIVRMISESPGSVIATIPTRKYLPQAVPNSMLFPP